MEGLVVAGCKGAGGEGGHENERPQLDGDMDGNGNVMPSEMHDGDEQPHDGATVHRQGGCGCDSAPNRVSPGQRDQDLPARAVRTSVEP